MLRRLPASTGRTSGGPGLLAGRSGAGHDPNLTRPEHETTPRRPRGPRCRPRGPRSPGHPRRASLPGRARGLPREVAPDSSVLTPPSPGVRAAVASSPCRPSLRDRRAPATNATRGPQRTAVLGGLRRTPRTTRHSQPRAERGQRHGCRHQSEGSDLGCHGKRRPEADLPARERRGTQGRKR
jgi:hypothetical protein